MGRADQAEETDSRCQGPEAGVLLCLSREPCVVEQAWAQQAGAKPEKLGANSCWALWAIVRILAFPGSEMWGY